MSPLFKKRLWWTIAGFVLFTLFFTAFGDRGLIKIYKLKQEIHRLRLAIESKKQHNEELDEDIRKMRHEHAFQEKSARETLGLAREGEMIYEFSD